jgi:transcriptional regulator with XRE-family HTH domain
MRGSQFQTRLLQELESRRKTNPRYSLRAFAAFLGTDHSTLSQIVRGKRAIPVTHLRQWGRKLALTKEEVAAYIAAEHVPPDEAISRQERLRHWSAEALAVSSDRVHWQLMQLLRVPEFKPDTRWIATQLGVSGDQVNVALSRLLRLRLLEMRPAGRWKSLLGPINETQFRKRALIKVRELAAEDGVNVRQLTSKPRR